MSKKSSEKKIEIIISYECLINVRFMSLKLKVYEDEQEVLNKPITLVSQTPWLYFSTDFLTNTYCLDPERVPEDINTILAEFNKPFADVDKDINYFSPLEGYLNSLLQDFSPQENNFNRAFRLSQGSIDALNIGKRVDFDENIVTMIFPTYLAATKNEGYKIRPRLRSVDQIILYENASTPSLILPTKRSIKFINNNERREGKSYKNIFPEDRLGLVQN